ncbi:hypothetical protein [Bacteroides sp. 224]|uniref:hypothetical protein n=1 Tax=Bacteroides sp. 224 TaxID=2302936 RepID=UPI0013D5F11B|nr:hypothetical protein [Bacteroides sp. 224]NDV66765.1 hypothetical protein [Bacteroides sp. 224]
MTDKLQEGDIFYVQYQGKYFFGKVLMDIAERMPVREIPMKSFHDCYLVGVYKGIYDEPILVETEFIISSIFTQKKQFYARKDKTDWHFYKNEPIDYKKDISFPESITVVAKVGYCFRCGEVQLPTKLTKKDWLGDFDIQQEVHFRYSTVLMMACHYQNRDDLMDFMPHAFLEKEDLRFTEKQRKEVYNQIGEDLNISYYELALKYGMDLGRFYE